ncbi:SMC-Scp complex subunit ScpB [Flavihumibacter solisilvae]|uniref:Chromosome segregation and condensation protein ScpB n=1 Tax=Flavihumibacter solisilvae TaxID=1349421 RepID=A0A0C1KTQ4_9BACT|nr:SMC-Scp complex subunit ScpB [Flavihumibacter solisilvae]KIC90786.1 chromosome segregation and condensation protein ScpB [Flavihumibacter solisilvae]
MEIGTIIPHIEALIFASEKPLGALELTDLINQAFGFMEDKITLEQIEAGIEGVVEKYQSEFYPFELRFSGGGWQFLTKKEYHKTVAQLNGDKFLKRLSPAAMETLAIIAYKQPITKSEIEAIRGVSADYSIQKLLEKELIIISGRNEEMPGKPLVYTTSRGFMDYFGLNGPEDLPRIKEVLADQIVEPTLLGGQQHVANGDDETVTDTLVDTETLEAPNSHLLVDESGELLESLFTEEEIDSDTSGQDSAKETENPDTQPGADEDESNDEDAEPGEKEE